MHTRLPYIGLRRILLALALLGCLGIEAVSSPSWAQNSAAPSASATAGRSRSRALILESVEARPADRGLELVLWRWLELDPGDEISSETLILARQRLLSSGYFDELDLYTARGSAPGQVVLVVEGKLDRSAHLETGFGYEPLDGWYLNLLGVRWNSPFHRGGMFRLGWSIGLRKQGLYTDWLRPSTAGNLDLIVSARTGTESWIVWLDDEMYFQNLDRNRVSIGLGRTRMRGTSALLWVGYATTRPDSTLEGVLGDGDPISIGDALPNITERQHILQAQLDLSHDRRDNRIAPRNGSYLGTRIRGGLVDGEQGYVRALADARHFVTLPGRSILGARLHGGWASPETPYYERFVFGGVDNVRGFADGSLSGPLGASAFWAGSLEWRAPLIGRSAPEPRLEGILFLDGGSHWDAERDAQSGALGIGYGLRLRLPWVQRIGVDVGIPLTDAPTGDPFWISMSLGYSF